MQHGRAAFPYSGMKTMPASGNIPASLQVTEAVCFVSMSELKEPWLVGNLGLNVSVLMSFAQDGECILLELVKVEF